jgi:hypothetical protein
MDEQSHKQEMAAALRADFERLRSRRGGTADAPEARESEPSGPASVSPAAAPSERGAVRRSLVAWLTGR